MKRLRALVCALFRHSRIVTEFWGYQDCARCDARLGDRLVGARAYGAIALKHLREDPDCMLCKKDGPRLTWFDWFLLRPEEE